MDDTKKTDDAATAATAATTKTDAPGADQATATTEVAQAEVVAVAEPVKEQHPALKVLDELDEKVNTLGGYAVSQLKPLVDQARSLLV